MPAKLGTVMSHSPSLCGRCATCKNTGDAFRRFTEYVVNLEDGEPETTAGAIKWMKNAYPLCPPPIKTDGWKNSRLDGIRED